MPPISRHMSPVTARHLSRISTIGIIDYPVSLLTPFCLILTAQISARC